MRISWDDGNRIVSQGISQGVLYPENSPGVAWNGLISVTEKGDATPELLYFDGQKYRNRMIPATFDGTLSAYTYPDEFELYAGIDGGFTAQNRLSFGLSYRNNNELHLLYNVTAAPSNDQYSTLSDSPNVVAFSWTISTVPVPVPTARPTAHLVISLAEVDPGALDDLEAMIYGDGSNDSSLPDPATVIDIFESHTTVRITDNGDGTWTASGPDTAVFLTDSTHFEINWPSAVLIDADSYTVYSL